MKKRLVIIGNGMAPGRVLETLLDKQPDLYEIIIFNAEPRVNYDRILLSPVLTGEKQFEDIIIHNEDWYAAHGITLHKGARVDQIDRDKKTVTSATGIVEAYDHLILATGSNPVVIPVPGHDLPGVLTFRDLDDVDAMLSASKSKKNAVVIGGGLLGLEAAAGLQAQGMNVTVLHLMPTLMERQLDAAAGYLLENSIRERGIQVITKANTHEITGDGKVESVRLDDGSDIPADIVVMAVGIRPGIALAQSCALETNRGILVDDQMFTSDPDISAVGECVEHRGQCYGLVAPLYEMAKVIGSRLALEPVGDYTGSITSTKLKVTGIDLFSAGEFGEAPDHEEIVFRDATRGIYKRLVLKDNKIIGAVLYGDTQDGAWFFQLQKDETDISDMRETVIFGPSYVGGSPVNPTGAVAALPPEAEICGCNGICKSAIVDAITDQGLTSVDEVRSQTKASASCGSCTGLVEQLLAFTLGDAFEADAVQTMCPCTDLGHDDVRRLIIAKEIKSIPQLMQDLEWKTSCGCAKCRPALNFYLIASWPGEYKDDNQSRFINERVHANIQKDGTYSVVPRMWGGMTTPDELRAIADVADKYDIPSVKVTGGQRIDLLGVQKEDLTAVWADLNAAGMVSGHAYAKGLRTVKTCVGTDWCRFGTQDSTGLGIKIEKMMWGSWTPHKVKMAVSGCPRNCAEATCKDFGVICVDSGYELHFAGAAGMHIKGTEVLCTVATEEEALEYCGALVQLYREQGHYLERIYKWADRVGFDTVREQIAHDGERRNILFRRFLFSQQFAQVDPWAERVAGKDWREFTPMANFSMLEAAE